MIEIVPESELVEITGYKSPTKIQEKLKESGIHYIRQASGKTVVLRHWLENPKLVEVQSRPTQPKFEALRTG